MEFNSQRVSLVHHMASVPLFWYTNMAAVTSYEYIKEVSKCQEIF